MRQEMVSLAQKVLDSHAYAIREALERVSAAGEDRKAVEDAQNGFASRAESMALLEEQLHDMLDEVERAEIKSYAEQVLDILSGGERDEDGGFFPLMEQLGLARNCRKATTKSRTRAGLCKCVGFIVCHKKCCVGGAGRGVGAGLWGCNHTVCDGCP
jgi:hypothetical protein